MTEHELHTMWASARLQIILSQLGPIVLLTASVGLVMAGLGHQPTPIRLAAALILLSTGILGALVQFSAASEAQAIASDLEALGAGIAAGSGAGSGAGAVGLSLVSRRIVASARFANVVKYVTPTIFVLTFLALLWAIFAPPAVGGMQ